MLEFVATVISQTSRSFVLSGALILSLSVAVSAFAADEASRRDRPAVATTAAAESEWPADMPVGPSSDRPATPDMPTHIPLAAGSVVAIDSDVGRIAVERIPQRRLFIDDFVMVLDVSDRSLLTGLSMGDKIRFDYEHELHRWILTRLEHSN